MALALATAFASAQSLGQANPTGGVAVHGQASFSTPTAGQLNVVTQNGAGTNHSAINWQSFSIAPGNSTNFQQPNAASTVINRVVTNTPSSIFGSLSSNGKLVLVNQSGIAIGAGAIVDTAGFTASALRMSDADALAGRLRFGDANASMGGAGGIAVEGRITARDGDVVLVAPNIDLGASALVQAPNGSTVLAAGQQVEITGRGLEGIKMLVQAPTDQVRSLGTLRSNAVGIFAGTLRHSGEIQATAASLEGGVVILKAAGDATVDGGGKLAATGTAGGRVDVLGQHVSVVDHAVIDVSGSTGGGTIRLGGDYQGRNPDVPHATTTVLGAQASLRADATAQGNGGKVIVWSEDSTRVDGSISARGASGGNGGFVETSGRHVLSVAHAPLLGPRGTWLLDPTNLEIYSGSPSLGYDGNVDVSTINSALAGGTSVVQTASSALDLTGPISATVIGSPGLSLSAGGSMTIHGSGGVYLSGAPIVTTLSAGGQIALQAFGNLNLGSGTLNMSAGTGITQDALSTISANGVTLSSTTGSSDLLGTNNNLKVLNLTGAASIVNFSALTVSSISSFNKSVSIDVGGSTLTLPASNIDLGTGDLTLVGVAGVTTNLSAHNISLTGNASMTTSGVLTASNNISLAAGSNVNVLGHVDAGGNLSISTSDNTGVVTISNVVDANTMGLSIKGGLEVLTTSTVDAKLDAANGQNISAKYVVVGSGFGTTASMRNGAGTQTIVTDGMNASSAGMLVSGRASVSNAGSAQDITVKDADYLRVLGNGGDASITSSGTQKITLQRDISLMPLNALEVGSATATGSSEIRGNGQTIVAGQVGQSGSITLRGGLTDAKNAQIINNAGAQSITTTGTLTMVGGNAPGLSAATDCGSVGACAVIHNVTGNLQDITAKGIDIKGGGVGSGSFNSAFVRSNGSQHITVDSDGIKLTGGSGAGSSKYAAIYQAGGAATDQQITVNGGGAIVLKGGSSPGAPPATQTGSAAFLEAAGDSQSVDFSAGGSIQITGGTVGAGNNAGIFSHHAQTIGGVGPLNITLRGGASGGGLTADLENSAGISADFSTGSGTQTITADSISLFGGDGGKRNSSAIYSGSSQSLNVGSGGLSLTGGGGISTDRSNGALVYQKGGAGSSQQITMGGNITLQAGHSVGTGVGFDALLGDVSAGSIAAIQARGDSQLIRFSASGKGISAVGGTAGSNNYAAIDATAGTQTINGTVLANAPTINLTGGSFDGTATEENGAFIRAPAGMQTISAKASTLKGGAGVNNTTARMVAPTQDLTFDGDLHLIGDFGSARIGGVGGTAGVGGSATDLVLKITTGSLTLTGDTGGAIIGPNSGSAVGLANTVNITTTSGDVVLSPGATGNARIGAPAGQTRPGSISVTAGGNIQLNSGGGTGTAGIRSAGNVTLSAITSGKSITEATDSVILANQLQATANSGINLDGLSNQVASFTASNSGAGDINYTNTNAPAALLTVGATGINNAGGNVRITADVLNINGAVNAGSGTVTLRPTTPSRNIIIENSPTTGVLSLSQGAIQQITAGTLDIGRVDVADKILGTGNIDVTVGVNDSDIHVGTLRFLAGNNFTSSFTGGIGNGSGTFNLQYLANNNVQLSGNALLGDNYSLTVVADNDKSGVGNISFGAVSLLVGSTSGNTTGNMSLAGQNITGSVSGNGAALLQVTGSGTQKLKAADKITLTDNNTTSGNLRIATSGTGNQQVDAGGTLTMTAGTGLGTNVNIHSDGSQTINANGIVMTAGITGGSFGNGSSTFIESLGNQKITVSAGGIHMTGGGGTATDNAASIYQFNTGSTQEINVTDGGDIVIQGGSSSQINVGTAHGSRAYIESDGDSQTIHLSGATPSDPGGTISLTGGRNGGRNFARLVATGPQTITGASNIILTGGLSGGATGGLAGDGNRGSINSGSGLQTVSAGGLTLLGGAGGAENTAEITTGGSQNITITDAAAVTIRARANKAGLFSSGNQAVTIQGATSSNALTIGDASAANVSYITGNNQVVTVGSTGQSGSITVLGGTAAGQNSGIFSNSGTQTVSTTGTLSLTGGTAVGTAQTCDTSGSGSCADISNNGPGLQKVTARNIVLQGGSGGVSNGAGIFVNGGPMQINAGTGGLHLTGGTGTSDNFASIGGSGANGQTLTFNVSGNTTLDATSSTVGSSAFIGLGGTGDGGSVTINFTGTGDLTLTGSNSNSTNGSAIGVSNLQTNATANLTISAANITLNPGTQAGVRIGHAGAANGNGNIDITATTGSIALNANASVGSAIRTTGDVTLHADSAGKSITSAAASFVRADTLSTSAGGATALPGPNSVNTLNANSGGGNIQFSNNQSLSLGTISTSSGAQNVTISTGGVGSTLSLGANTGDDNWTLVAGGALNLSGALSENNISLTSGTPMTVSQNLTATGSLSLITPNGDAILQSAGRIAVDGQTIINAGTGNVTITATNNDFNQIGVTGGTVRIRDMDDVALGNSSVQKLVLQSTGNLALNGALTATGAGDAVALVSVAGLLNAAGGSISTPSGRWLLYLAAPGASNFGSLTPIFKQYNATLASTVEGAGNGLLYGLAPTISATLGTGTPATKVYDATTAIDVSSAAYTVSATGAVDGDVVTLSKTGSGVLDNKNVGAGKTVTVGVHIANQTNPGFAHVYGYTFLNTTQDDTVSAGIGNVTQANLPVLGISANNRMYDTTTAATLTGTAALTALGTDVVTVGGTGVGTFANKNVGTAKPVTVTGYTLSGPDSGNYMLVQPVGLTADITPATISSVGSIGAASKVYDGSTSATLNTAGATFNGRLGSDVLTVASATGNFINKNVGEFKQVNITVSSLGGADAGNYTLANPTSTANADITAASITLSGITAANKVYDGTTAATVNTGSITLGGKITGDAVSVSGGGSGTFSDKNAGTGKTVTITGLTLTGSDADNYTLVNNDATTTADITRAGLLVTGLGASSKVYDATAAATITGLGSVTPIGEDIVSVGGTGTGLFGDKNVGTAKAVTLSGITLTGSDAANYTAVQPALTADITPAVISAISGITAANKTYDGNTSATLDKAGAVFSGKLGSDVLTVAGGTGTFSDKNVGLAKTVVITGLGLEGADAPNYTLSNNGGSTSAAINRANITVSGIIAIDKVYDTTAVASLAGNPTVAPITGDTLTLGGTGMGAFANKNVGTAKPVTVSGFTLSGADAGNYTLEQPVGLAADITPAKLAVTGVGASNKVYNATTGATLTGSPSVTPLVNDTVTVGGSGTGTFSDKNVGTAKPVAVSGLTLVGADAANYTLVPPSGLVADITRASILAVTGIGGASKVYDGNTAITVNAEGASFTGIFAGDKISVASTSGNFADRNVGSGKTLNVTGITLGGADAGNYTLVNSTASTTGSISARPLSTWTGGAGDHQWFNAGNWDALPDGNNVLAVSIPAGAGTVVFGNVVLSNNVATSTPGTASLRTLSSASTVTQGAGSSIRSDLLSLDTSAGISLNSAANRIAALRASNSGSGDIVIANTGVLELQAMANTAGGITVTNTGATTTGAIAATGAVNITANSPLTVGGPGIAAGGDVNLVASNLTSAGNLTIDGKVTSLGKVTLSAGNDLVQNGAVFGANGVSASAGGKVLFGPLATANIAPSYTANGVAVSPPGEQSQTAAQVNVLLTFLDQFEKALGDRLGESTTNPDGSKKRKSEDGVVTEAVCK